MSQQVFEHRLHVSPPSLKKLKAMMQTKVRHTSINSPKASAPFYCHAENHAKLMDAHENRKTATIMLSPEEIDLNKEQSGTGFFKTLHKLGVSKKQFNKPGKAIVKAAKQIGITPKSTVSALKTVAKIALPTLAKAGAAAGTAYLTGSPLAAKIASDVAGNAVQSQMSKIGSGLYVQNRALNLARKGGREVSVVRHLIGAGLSINQYDRQNIKDGTLAMTNVLAHDHPARNPFIPRPEGTLVQTAGSRLYGGGIYAPGR
jgi:hypothetical protein